MKQLRLTDEKHLNKLERYLWGLSMGSHPKLHIIKDLLNKYLRTQNMEDKIQETLILAIASMTDKYIRNPNNLEKKKVTLIHTLIYVLNTYYGEAKKTGLQSIYSFISTTTFPRTLPVSSGTTVVYNATIYILKVSFFFLPRRH